MKLAPPEVYLQPVKADCSVMKVNDDLLKCVIKKDIALQRSNDDKKKIIEWLSTQ